MVIQELPQLQNYWSSDAILDVAAILKIMTAKRYKKLTETLLCNNNKLELLRTDSNRDKLYQRQVLSKAVYANEVGEMRVQVMIRVLRTFFKHHGFFGFKMDKLDKPWVPHKVSKSCVESLRFWQKGKRAGLHLGIPMNWMEPKNHFDDCYFCVVDAKRFNRIQTWRYPDLQSIKCPVLHNENLPRPIYVTKVIRMPSETMMLPNSQKSVVYQWK
ncbi:hypothetical protein CBL_10108 [Carabus blaptoides fortunei]